jgi:hypothetical protein
VENRRPRGEAGQKKGAVGHVFARRHTRAESLEDGGRVKTEAHASNRRR